MKNCILTVFFLSALLTMTSSAEELVIGTYVFDNPLGPTKVERLGPDAWGCTWPENAPHEQADIELIVASFSPAAVNAVTEGGGSMEDMTLSTYFGLGGQPEGINKTLFMGSTSARRVYPGKTPRAHEAHVFSKSLDDGGFVMLGVRFFTPPSAQSGKLLQSIANTFRRR